MHAFTGWGPYAVGEAKEELCSSAPSLASGKRGGGNNDAPRYFLKLSIIYVVLEAVLKKSFTGYFHHVLSNGIRQ